MILVTICNIILYLFITQQIRFASEDIRFKNKVNSGSTRLVGLGGIDNKNFVSAKPGTWDAGPKSHC